MNPAALLALLSDLYAQLLAAQERAVAAERQLAEMQQEGDGEPERRHE